MTKKDVFRWLVAQAGQLEKVEEPCCPTCGGHLGHAYGCSEDNFSIHHGMSPKDFYKQDDGY